MDFSVLEAAQQLLKEHGQMTAVEPGGGEQGAVRGGATTRIGGGTARLLRWCRSTEQVVIARKLEDARVFAGFEHLSRARFVRKRYLQIGGISRSLHVLGRPDAALDFPVTSLTPIESGPMLREWFLLVDSEAYCGLLTARDLDGLEEPCSPAERTFEGLVTHHVATIRGLADELEDRIVAASEV